MTSNHAEMQQFLMTGTPCFRIKSNAITRKTETTIQVQCLFYWALENTIHNNVKIQDRQEFAMKCFSNPQIIEYNKLLINITQLALNEM